MFRVPVVRDLRWRSRVLVRCEATTAVSRVEGMTERVGKIGVSPVSPMPVSVKNVVGCVGTAAAKIW